MVLSIFSSPYVEVTTNEAVRMLSEWYPTRTIADANVGYTFVGRLSRRQISCFNFVDVFFSLSNVAKCNARYKMSNILYIHIFMIMYVQCVICTI